MDGECNVPRSLACLFHELFKQFWTPFTAAQAQSTVLRR